MASRFAAGVAVAALLVGIAHATPTDDLFEAVRIDDKKRIASALHHGADINAKVSDELIFFIPSFDTSRSVEE